MTDGGDNAGLKSEQVSAAERGESGKVDSFDALADPSPLHIYDSDGTFCGKANGGFSRGIDYRSVEPDRLLLADTCSQCWSAWKYMKDRD
jgi:hypothetical protein